MRYPFAFIIFTFIFFLQTTLLHNIAVFGYSPNLILCLVVVFSFLYQEKYALFMGIIFGILLDLTTAQYVGISSLALVAVYFTITWFKNRLNNEQLVPDVLISLLATAMYSLIYWAIYTLMGSPYGILHMLQSLPVLLIYNAIFVLIFHLLLSRTVMSHRNDRCFNGNVNIMRNYKKI